MVNRLDDAFAFHENALRLRAQRQQVLASNMANADTPGYQARDFDFASVLRQTLAGTASPATLPLAATAPAHFDLAATLGATMPATQVRPANQNSRDGNTVDLDIERSAFTENALRYETGLTLLSGRIKGLMSVIQG